MHMEGAVRRRNAFAHRTIRRRHSPDKRSIAIPMTNSARRLRAQNNAPLALARRDSTAHIHGRSGETTHRTYIHRATRHWCPACRVLLQFECPAVRVACARKQRAVGFGARGIQQRIYMEGAVRQRIELIYTGQRAAGVRRARAYCNSKGQQRTSHTRGQNDAPLVLARRDSTAHIHGRSSEATHRAYIHRAMRRWRPAGESLLQFQ